MATEYRRYTIDEANAGLPEGWTFAGGWYPFSGSFFAWFSRDVKDDG